MYIKRAEAGGAGEGDGLDAVGPASLGFAYINDGITAKNDPFKTFSLS